MERVIKPVAKFFYQLKVESKKEYYSEWEVVWFDVIEAESKAEAKKIIEIDHGAVIAEKVTKKSPKKIDYRVFITELTPSWEQFWLKENECKCCGKSYTVLESRKNMETSANPDVCSNNCYSQIRRLSNFDNYSSGYGNHNPCIYRIFNKVTGMSYVGQTTQCFTLRWYQHFFQPSETKFHESVKTSKPTDWTFEVLEVIEGMSFKKDIDNREQFWIEYFNSIENGYNSKKAS